MKKITIILLLSFSIVSWQVFADENDATPPGNVGFVPTLVTSEANTENQSASVLSTGASAVAQEQPMSNQTQTTNDTQATSQNAAGQWQTAAAAIANEQTQNATPLDPTQAAPSLNAAEQLSQNATANTTSNTTTQNQTQAVAPAPSAAAQVVNNTTQTQTPPVVAVPVQNYSIEVQVAGNTDAERHPALIQALQKLLEKLSGNANINNLPQVKSKFTNVESLVQSYTYITHPAPNMPAATFLVVQFDPKGIETLLHQATQTVWSAQRPTTLVWLAIAYAPLNVSFIDEGSYDAIVPVIHKNAENLGMPIMLPALDLLDSGRVKAEDVCNLNEQTLKNASQRYGVNSILAGCLVKPIIGTTWTSSWIMLNKDKRNQWNTNGTSAEDVVSQAMLHASQYSGKKPGQVNEVAPESVVMRITNVKGLSQYTEVVQYLRTLSPVVQVDLLNLGATEIEVNVSCLGGQQALLTALSAQAKLQPNTNSQNVLPPGVDLDFTLTGGQ